MQRYYYTSDIHINVYNIFHLFSFSFCRPNLQVDKQEYRETSTKIRRRSRNKTRNNNERNQKNIVRESINLVNQTKSIKRDLINADNSDIECLGIDKGIEEGLEKDIEDEGVKMNSSCCSSESSSSLASSMMSSESHHNVNDVMSVSNSSNDIINEEIDEEDEDVHKGIRKISLNGNIDNVTINSGRDMRLNLANMNGIDATMSKQTATTPNNNTSLTFVPSTSCSDAIMTTGTVHPTTSAASMSSSGNATCTFSRTFPNCGTYFFRHVSSAEDDDEDEDDVLDNDTLSTSLLSSSSPTPRPAGDDDFNTVMSPVITSSPLKSDSGSHLPDFDLDEDDDEDLDLACALDKDTLLSAGLNVSDDLNITDGNGRLVPILDFSYMNNGESDLEAIIDSPESCRRKRDIKKLVGDAEKLLFQTVSFTSDESEIEPDEEISSSEFEQHNGAVSASELTCYQSASRKNSIAFPPSRSSGLKQHNCQGTHSSSGYKRSHSFHNYYGSCNPQSDDDEQKEAETSMIIRRKRTNKVDGQSLISNGKKSFSVRGSRNATVRNTININNNNSNDYGCDASGEGKDNIFN